MLLSHSLSLSLLRCLPALLRIRYTGYTGSNTAAAAQEAGAAPSHDVGMR